MKKTGISLKTAFAVCVCVCTTTASMAADGVWSGTVNALWTNSLNWSSSPYPFGNDTASFTNAGNGQSMDITGLASIKNITFDSPTVAAYTNGIGAANSQTMVMLEGGEIKLTDTAANSQVFNCGLQLGATIGGGTYTLTNGNLGQTLTFNNVFSPAGGAAAGAKILAINGAGNTTILGNIAKGGATSLTLIHNSSGTLSLSGSNVITTLTMNGGTNSVIDIGNGTLFLNNGGGRVLDCNQGGVITGTGKIRLSTIEGFNSPGYNYADMNVAFGKTLVINPEITGLGGLESNAGNGTFVLNGTNTFEGHVTLSTASPFSVFRIGNRGSIDSNLGKGSIICFNSNGKLIYTGTGETSDRQIILNNTGTLDQSGPSGKLTFSVAPTIIGGGKTLILQGSTVGIGEFTAPLTNSGGNSLTLTKAGAGTWILSGTNTYTGNTTVNGGKLLVNSPGMSSGSAMTVNNGSILGGNSTINGNVALNAGGILAPGDVGSIGTLNLGGTLGLTSGTLFFDVSNVATDKVSVVGALTVTGTNTIVLSFPDGTLPAGTSTLMTFASRTGAGTFVLSPAYVNASLFTNATSVQLVVTDTGTSSKIWKGNISGNWDTTDANWTNGSEAVVFGSGDAVQFDDTASIFNVGGSSSVLPSSVLFNNSINNYVLSVAMEGTGVIFKIGSGTVTLSGANTLSGQTTIAEGMLTIGETGVLGGGNYATNIINNGALNYSSSVAQTNSGVISGGGSLTSSGSGTLTLLGANTYIGPTTINAGVLKIQNAAGLGSNAEGTTVAAGATLELAGGITTLAEALNLCGTLSSQTGNNTYAGAMTFQSGALINVGSGSTNIISGNTLANGYGFTKVGAGTLRITLDPNQTGPFVVNEGTLELQHGGGTDAAFIIGPGATLRELNANIIADAYAFINNGTFDMRVAETVSTLIGTGLVTVAANVSVAFGIGNDSKVGTFSGVIENGLGTMTVTKYGTGVQTLSGASTYSGGTTLAGGQLNINNGGSSGTSSAIGRGTFTISGYTIDNTSGADIKLSPNNAQIWNGEFTFVGSKSLNLGTGAVTLGGNRTVTVLTNTLTVGGVISGAFSLTKAGAGTLTLSGASAYSGATTVNGGTLLINGSTVAASAVTVNSGAILGGSGTINGTVNVAAGGILAPGGVNTTNTLTLTNTGNALTLNSNTLLFDLPASGTVCDKINITSGKLVLNGANKVALSFPYGAAPAGSYILMTCTGGITTNSGVGLTLQSDYPDASLATVGNNVVLTLGSNISGVTWKGNVSGVWDNDSLNWTTNGIDLASYTAGNVVTFDDTATENFIVSSVGTVSPASLLFNNSTNDYFISADLSGTGPLVKLGADTATLLGVSTYSPVSIIVNEGTLALGGASQLNSGLYGTNIINNGTFSYASSAMQTNSGILSGGGTLVVSGSGTLTLSSANTYTGPTVVNAGMLKILNAAGLGTTAAGTTVASGAKLELEGNITIPSNETLNLFGILSSQTGNNTYAGVVTFQHGSSIDVGSGSTNILTASTTGSGVFTKNGLGLLRLTVDPNHSGVWTVSEGTLELNAGTTDAEFIINPGATLRETANALGNYRITNNGSFDLRASDDINGLDGNGRVTSSNTGSYVLTVGNGNQAGTFSGVIENGTGTMGFTKTGNEIQILTGTNTYTGATTVSGGTLLVNSPGSLSNSAVTVNAACILGGNGSINGNVIISTGGILVPGGMNASGTLTLDKALTLNGNTLFFDVSSAVTDQVVVGGVLTINGVNTVALSFPDGALPAGDYTLITFSSKVDTGSFVLLGNYPSASLVYVGNSLVLRVSGGNISGLTWNGNTSAFWDMELNWKLGTTAANFVAGDVVTFDDTASSLNVISSGVVSPSSIFFNNNIDNPYFVAATLDGTAPILKMGLGMATMSALINYNPTTITVNAGTLILGGASLLNNGNYTIPIVINSGSFNHSSSATQLLSGVISGGGNVTKAAAGSLTLTTANTYSGGTFVSGGTLYGANVSAFGTAARTLTLSGGILDLALDTLFNAHPTTVSASSTIQSDRATSGVGIIHTLGTLSIGNNTLYVRNGPKVNANSPYGLTFGTTTLSSATPTFDVGNNGTGVGTLTLGALINNNSFNKANAGTLFLGTTSARAGGTAKITGGTLKLGHVAGLGTVAALLELNGGTLGLATDATVNAHPTAVTASSTIQSDKASVNSVGITHTLGTLNIGNFTLSVTSGANLIANSPYGVTFGVATLTANTATFNVGNNGTGIGTLTLGALTGNFNISKAGAGLLYLGTAANVNRNSASSTLTAGTLKLGHVSALSTTVAAPLALNGGILDLATDTTVNAHPTTVGGNTTIQSDKATANSPGITHTLGTLSIGNNTLSVTAGANISTNSPYGLTFGAVTITGNTPTFDVANNGAGLGTLTFGVVGGAFSLNKNGAGTLILPGANTYSGTTTVNGGTLLVNGSTVSGSAITVNNGAILGGSGSITGAVTVAAGGMLAPGGINATNTLTLANTGNALTLNGNTLFFDLPASAGAACDKINITAATGKLVWNGASKIALSFPYGPAPAGTYTLMTCTGGITTNAGGTLTLLVPYPNATLSVIGNNVVLTTTSTLGLTWKGNLSDVWDNGILNWTNGSAAASFATDNAVIFDDTAARFVVSSVSPVLPASVMFNNSVSNYTVSAVIGGTGPLVKSGSGTVTLSGTNTVSGGTIVNNGLLILTGTNTGDIGSTTINSSGVLQIGNGGTSGTLLGSGTVTSGNNNGLQFNRTDPVSSPLIVNNKIDKNGSVAYSLGVNSGAVQIGGTADNNSNAADVKNSGTLILAKVSSGSVHALGANSLVESGGTLMLGGTGGDQIYSGVNVNVLDGGVFDVNSLSEGFTTLTLAGTGISNNGALVNSTTTASPTLTCAVTLSASTSIGGPGNLNITGVIAGPSLGIAKVGGGTLTLNGANTYSGGTTINAGNSAIAPVVGSLGTGVVTNNGILNLTAATGNADYSYTFGNLSGSGTVNMTLPPSGNSRSTRITGTTNFTGILNVGVNQIVGSGRLYPVSQFLLLSAPAIVNINLNSTLLMDKAVTNTAAINLYGGTTGEPYGQLRIENGVNWAGPVTLFANSTFGGLNGIAEISGDIGESGGSFGFTRVGSTGTTILSGTNTYTGPTLVSGGTLIVSGSTASGSAVMVSSDGTLGGTGTINGTVNMATGATLIPGGTNAIGTLVLGNDSADALSLNGALLRFDLSNEIGVCDKIVLTGSSSKLVLTGTNSVALSFLYGFAPAGTYTLMTCAGGITINAGATIKLQVPYPNATLDIVGNDVILTTTGAGTYGLTWKGNVSGVWDSGMNWTNGSIAAAFTSGDLVTFDDTATGNFTVSSDNPVSPAFVSFNNNVNPYTVLANIVGTGPLVKQGSSTATLSGVSTYNPAFFTISAGTLTLTGASQLNSGNYSADINNNGTFGYASTPSQTLSGVISGSGALIKSGSGTLTLLGTNTYAGATTLNAGVLKIQNNTALGSTAAGTTVAAGTTLELVGDITTPAEALTLYGLLSSQAGTNTYGGAVTVQTGASFDVATGSILILSASIGGTTPFTKTGEGTLRFTRDPNNSGVMTINGGVAEITAGTTDGDIVINSGAMFLATSVDVVNDAKSVTVNTGGIYDLRGSDNISSLSGTGLVTRGTTGTSTLTLGGNNNGGGSFSGVIENGLGTLSLTKVGTGIQTLSGVNTFSGNMSVAGTLILAGAGQLGNGFYAGAIANTGLLVHDSSATQTLSGAISGTAGALCKTGTGMLMLSGINTYTGATSISNGVVLGITGGNCTNSAVTVQSSGSGTTATLGVRYMGSNTKWSCASLTTAASVLGGNAPNLIFVFNAVPTTPVLNVSGNVAFDASTTITVAPANLAAGDYPLLVAGGTVPTTTPAVTMGQGMSGAVSWGKSPFSAKTLVLTVSGTYTEPLTWDSTASGTWNVNVGDNVVWKNNAGIATNYQEFGFIGDQVVFDDTVTADTVVTLNSIVNPATVTFNNAVRQYTLSGSGTIAGFVDLVKSDTGTVILATANTYSGSTLLNSGNLILGNNLALPAGNNLSMAGTATLDLNGYAPSLNSISASVVNNTITDNSAGAGKTVFSILNQPPLTINALIKDGANKILAVNFANANQNGPIPFAVNASNTYSGGLTLKNSTVNGGTRMWVGGTVVTVGTPGNIISSPFGTGPISIGEASTDKAQLWINTVGTIVNDLIVNTSLGTDQGYAFRVDGTVNTLSGKVTANTDVTFGTVGTGSVTLNNELSGTGGVKVVTAGVTVNLAGANTYSGRTSIQAGTLAVEAIGNADGNASPLGAHATPENGAIRFGSGNNIGTLLYRGMGTTTDRIIDMAGTTGGGTIDHSGTNLLKFTSDLLISGVGAKQLKLQGATSISTGEVAGVISDSSSGAVNVYKAGGAVWRLSGDNLFSGNVAVGTGILVVAKSGALGVGNKTVLVNTGNSMPELHLDGSMGDIVLGTNILFETSNSTAGSIHNIKGTNTIMGSFLFTSGNSFSLFNSRADKLYMTGNMKAKEVNRELHLRGNGDGEISGVIADGVTTNMPVYRDGGSGTWTLSGSNTYNGATSISSGTLAAGSDQAFGTNVVNLTGGNLGGAVGMWSITNTVNAQNNAGIITEGTLILSGLVNNNAALNKTGAGTLLLNGSKTGTGALTVSTGVLGGIGTIAGTVTNLATITAADTNSIGTLTLTNLVMASNSTNIWNCNAVTQDVINVTGTLTLPSVATVIVNEDMVGDIGLKPRTLFTFTTGPASGRLPNWVIIGADERTAVRVDGKQVTLFRLGGTMITIR